MATNDDRAPPVPPADSGAGLILAPGLHPFLGIRRLESKSFLERLQTSLDLPDYLIIAKKSLVNTMSVLYMIMLIVTCMVLVTTETITRIYDPLKKYQFRSQASPSTKVYMKTLA